MAERASPSRLVTGILLGLAATGAALPAAAQRSNSGVAIGPSEELSHPPSGQSSAPAPQVEHLFRERGDGRQGGGGSVRRPGERPRDGQENGAPRR